MARTDAEVMKDCLTGNLIVRNSNTGEKITIHDHELSTSSWKYREDIPIWATSALISYLRTETFIDSFGRTRKPHMVDDDGKAQRQGDKWFTWGLLRTKKRVDGVYMVQAVVQVRDSDEVERHATMAGSGDTPKEARADMLQHMYEMKATIEDAIVSIKGGIDGQTEG